MSHSFALFQVVRSAHLEGLYMMCGDALKMAGGRKGRALGTLREPQDPSAGMGASWSEKERAPTRSARSNTVYGGSLCGHCGRSLFLGLVAYRDVADATPVVAILFEHAEVGAIVLLRSGRIGIRP